jgi:ferredoxin, 2Fe-2S
VIEFISKTSKATAEPIAGMTVLNAALSLKLDWGFHCTRGTCARCRSLVTEGMEHLEPPTKAEIARLEPEELEAGFRLACQTVLKGSGPVQIKHKPYF